MAYMYALLSSCKVGLFGSITCVTIQPDRYPRHVLNILAFYTVKLLR